MTNQTLLKLQVTIRQSACWSQRHLHNRDVSTSSARTLLNAVGSHLTCSLRRRSRSTAFQFGVQTLLLKPVHAHCLLGSFIPFCYTICTHSEVSLHTLWMLGKLSRTATHQDDCLHTKLQLCANAHQQHRKVGHNDTSDVSSMFLNKKQNELDTEVPAPACCLQ